MIETDVQVGGGRTLHVYDTGEDPDHPLTVLWHHGTPNIGVPPLPLFSASDRLGIRWVSYDRPGYGGSSPAPGRTVASAAASAIAVTDALGIERFAVMGHSGGSPHAMACAALLPDRVFAVVAISGLAPYGAEGLDWYAGMAAGGVASLSAAAEGRQAKERYEASESDLDFGFVPADEAALLGEWSWFLDVVRPALAAGPGPLIDDDLAYVSAWGFDPAAVRASILLVHGEDDRVVPSTHSAWLAVRCRTSELWLRPGEGHVSVMSAGEAALAWLMTPGRTSL